MKIHKMSDFSEKIEIPDYQKFSHTFYNHPRSIEGAWAFWKVGTHQHLLHPLISDGARSTYHREAHETKRHMRGILTVLTHPAIK